MARDWHELFRTWAKPPSESEEAKASRAAQMIRDALRGDTALASRDFIVYPTGSYRNNTNIRLGSDVDVAVVFRGAFFYEIPPGRSPAEFGLGQSASYGLEDFRAEVSRALVAKFGAGVQARAKTFTILGNSSRLPADATPFLPHRMYTGRRRPDGAWEYQEGVETRPTTEPARRIINWHQEHYDSGVAKNTATRRRYKRVVRILKRLRDDMGASGSLLARGAASTTASFLLECLPYNVVDGSFSQVEGSYYQDVRAVILAMWNATKDEDSARSLVEVSRRKLLFGKHQGWTRADANAFLQQAWHHVGFG